MTKDNTPVVRAMNFVRIDDFIYFHGATSGEKIEGLAQAASFTAYKALSLIPSHWSDERNACPATSLFQSVVVKGVLNLVMNVESRAIVMQKLMEKLQPEGKFLPLNTNSDFYNKSLNRVSIFMLSTADLSYKIKLGQNWDLEKRQKVRSLLLQRGASIDSETVELMEEFGLFLSKIEP